MINPFWSHESFLLAQSAEFNLWKNILNEEQSDKLMSYVESNPITIAHAHYDISNYFTNAVLHIRNNKALEMQEKHTRENRVKQKAEKAIYDKAYRARKIKS